MACWASGRFPSACPKLVHLDKSASVQESFLASTPGYRDPAAFSVTYLLITSGLPVTRR